MTTRNRELAGIIDDSGNITAGGNLTVSGTTTTVSSTVETHADPLIELNTGAGSNSNDLGFVFERGSTGDNACLIWDESNDVFAVGTTTATGTSTGNMSFTVAGLTAAVGTFSSLDISGNADIDGTLEADVITVDGTALNEYIADTVGAMVSSNTETNVTVTYEDGDNTLDFVVGTLNQDTTGTADNITITANNSTDETVYPIFVDGTSGSQGGESDSGLTYNPSSGLLTTTLLAGTLNTAAQTNITSVGTLTSFRSTGIDDNTDALAMTLDSSERVLIGHTSSIPGITDMKLQVNATDSTGSIQLTRWTDNAIGSYLSFCKSRNGTIGSNTVVQDGDGLGQITWNGDDGTDLNMRSSAIYGRVDGTPGSNDMPGRLEFITTPDGQAFDVNNIRMVIKSDGKVGVGTTSPDGPLHVQSATAGSVAADAEADELVLENSSNTGLSILIPGDGLGSILFGNPGTNGQKDGAIRYYGETHATTANRRNMVFTTGNSERLRIGSSGQIGIGGANYGTDGQILTSTGTGTAPAWEDAAEGGISTGKAIAMAMVFG